MPCFSFKGDLQMANRHENMLNVANHQRNTNYNHNEISPHTYQNGIINISTKQCWWGCGKKGTLVHCWWECRLVQPLWKIIWGFLKKLKMELPFDPAIPPLGIYPKNSKTLIQKNMCTPMFIATLFAIAKVCKHPKCPSVDEWIKTNDTFTQWSTTWP